MSKQINSAPSSETNCYAYKAIHIYILDTLVFATFHVNVFINWCITIIHEITEYVNTLANHQLREKLCLIPLSQALAGWGEDIVCSVKYFIVYNSLASIHSFVPYNKTNIYNIFALTAFIGDTKKITLFRNEKEYNLQSLSLEVEYSHD